MSYRGKDLKGKRFGKLLVLEEVPKRIHNAICWKCKCDCGKEVIYRGTDLRRYKTSCGCDRVEKIHKYYFQDLKGKIYHYLRVVEFLGYKKEKKVTTYTPFWKCYCDPNLGGCGKYTSVRQQNLLRGHTLSCGCYRKKQSGKGQKKIAGKNHPLRGGYEDISGSIWSKIQKNKNRGTRVLSFNITLEYIWKLFLKQKKKCALSGKDISFGKTKKTQNQTTASLDRIDSQKGYIKGNVQWVHKDVNNMKQNFSEEYFLEMCHSIVKNKKYPLSL